LPIAAIALGGVGRGGLHIACADVWRVWSVYTDCSFQRE
jgi:hypothetical protein